MHAVVLAAGFGSRLAELGETTPKPLLPLGRGCVLDQVVTSVWVPGITAIQVVHNQAVFDGGGSNLKGTKVLHDWGKSFKRWARSVSWNPEPGRNKERPYIKLVPNAVRHEEERRGAVGDLAWTVKRFKKRTDPILVVCADDLFVHPELPKLSEGGHTKITCRAAPDLSKAVNGTNPSKVRIEGGMVAEIGDLDDKTPWRFCGPFILQPEDFGFLFEYAELLPKAGLLPDSIGDFLQAMVEDGRPVAAHRTKQRFGSAGTVAGYKEAKGRWLGGVTDARRMEKYIRQVKAGDAKLVQAEDIKR